MLCVDCETVKMKCNNTKEKDNVRYRIYICPVCKLKAYSRETEILTKEEFSEAYNVLFAGLDELAERRRLENRDKTNSLQ